MRSARGSGTSGESVREEKSDIMTMCSKGRIYGWGGGLLLPVPAVNEYGSASDTAKHSNGLGVYQKRIGH